MKLLHNGIPAFAGMTSRFRIYLCLTSVIIIGGFFRLYAVNWDSFGAFHPDERNISWAVTRINFFSQMDPKFFAYGGLPIYLYRALGEGVVYVTKNPTWLYDWGHIAVIGRYVSGILSTISLVLMFLVGASYFSPTIGLLATTFLAFSPWAIQQAHFQTTETMLVFFVLLITYISHSIFVKPTVKNILKVGLIWGLAMAAKTTSLLFGAIPLAALWIPVLDKQLRVKTVWNILGKRILFSLLLGATTAIIFFCFSPYTILDYQRFNESMLYESGVALGRFTVPYTLQFLHTTPYLYNSLTMLWQAGPLVIVGLAGLIALILSVIPDLIGDLPFFKRNTNTDSRLRGNDKSTVIFLIFPIVYFGWVGTWFAKFARYNVPFLPFVTIAAAWFCISCIKRSRIPGLAFTAILLITTIIWGFANWTAYLRPQTKITATHWIVEHIPTNATIYTEHWNDGLPLDLPAQAGLPRVPSYYRELLTVYDVPDDDTKRIYYADKLSVGDYIILSTRRIWATMPGLGEKYPVTSIFYKKLLDGTLGYTEVSRFTSYPQLFGVQINDDTAEESIQVFDHPTVRIFQNTQHLTKTALLSIL